MKKTLVFIISALCSVLLASCVDFEIRDPLSDVISETPITLNESKTTAPTTAPIITPSVTPTVASTETPEIKDIEIKESEIIGTWQANNMVAAGFCDSYVFDEDGTFYFLANQMVYHQIRNMKGTWSLGGDNIILKITDKIITKDFDVNNEGFLHPDAYEYETEKIHPEEAETVKLLVTKPEEDAEVPHYSPTITINGEKFWNFTNDIYLTEEMIGIFENKDDDNPDKGVIYLDIDNDGEKEKTEYIAEQNILKISRDAKILIEANLYDFGYDFNGLGMDSVLYYFDYVYGLNYKIFLHLYRTSLIGDTDGKRHTSALEDYYEISDNQMNLIDSIKYTLTWDYSDIESIENIIINGTPALSLESIESKYTAIEHTYFEITY